MNRGDEVPPCWTGGVRAEVRSGASVTGYVRAGTGRPVVFLVCEERDRAPWPALMTRLAARFRVIVPERPPCDADAAVWLRRFVEGLGLWQITLVTDDTLSVPAIGLALLDPDRVDGVAVVSRCCGDGDHLEGALANIRGPGARPLRIVARDQSLDTIAERLEEFLGRP